MADFRMNTVAANGLEHSHIAPIFGETTSYGSQIGTAQNSTIHNTFNNTTVNRPEIPPPPSCFVPFSRDPHFVERGSLLDQIYQNCCRNACWTALTGLGGVGKSQLALEYAYRVHHQKPDRWIFWVHASTAARFEQSLQELAEIVKIPDRKTPQANIFDLVHRWLRDQKNGKWLIILDNLDDARFMFDMRPCHTETSSGNGSKWPSPLIETIPRTLHGVVLLTTRDKTVARRLMDEDCILTVEPMDDTQAVCLLTTRLKTVGEQRDSHVVDLARTLEYMPLAMVQAAAYISNLKYSIPQYIDQYQNAESKKEELLDYDEGLGYMRRDWEAEDAIAKTWQISFEYLRQTRKSAADLLSLMSFCDHQGIPRILIQSRPIVKRGAMSIKVLNGENDNDIVMESMGVTEFRKDVHILENYSFISANKDMSVFEIHNLVQFATQKWLRHHGSMELWKQKFITNLYREFPNGAYKTWVKCQALIPHVRSALSHEPEQEHSLQEWATVMHRGATFALFKGNVADGEELSVRAMRAREKVFGLEHPATLWSKNVTGFSYILGSKIGEAEKAYREAVEISSRVFGHEHPVTRASVHGLASTYGGQGRYKEAEDLEVKLVEIGKRLYGAAHPFTLGNISNLALTYIDQGRWKEAEVRSSYVIENIKEILGPEHPLTLLSMKNLAYLYQRMGRWTEAESLQTEVVQLREKVLGPDHPSTLISLSSLANLYIEQGRSKEAEEAGTRAVEGLKKVFRVKHHLTFKSTNILASIYEQVGRWAEAESLQASNVEAMKTTLGLEHIITLGGIANLSAICRRQGRLKEAEELGARVLETRKRLLGLEHSWTVDSMSDLATTYRGQGRWEQAKELEECAMESRKKAFGPDSPQTLLSMTRLSLIYNGEGRWSEAEQLAKQAVDRSKAVLGERHPRTLACIANLATVFKDKREDMTAIELMIECVEGRKKTLGPDHPFTKESEDLLNQWCIDAVDLGAPEGDGIWWNSLTRLPWTR